ncbi:MAG: dockerin type I repeat-containing protein [bacterium]
MRFRLTSSLLFLVLLIGLSATAQADDPNDPIFADTIRFACPVEAGWPAPDSIGLPLYIWADDSIGSFTLGFVSNSEYLTWSSFSHEGTVFPAGWVWPTPYIVPAEQKMLIGAYDGTGLNHAIFSRGLIGTLYLHVDPDIPHSTICDIDSAKVGLAGDFVLSIIHNGPPAWAVGITPELKQCGTDEIIFGVPPCGDANGDGIPNITDAVFLIAYIFSDGPEPDPYEAGDADCDTIVNISDAVYLVQYIFNSGPAPCENCP